jgi:hypothetical protein
VLPAVAVGGLAVAAAAVGFAVLSEGSTPPTSPVATVVPLVEPSPTATRTPRPPTATPPPTPTNVPVEILNGWPMQMPEGRGFGELTIENGTSQDAIVKLYDPRLGRSIRGVYVVRGESWTITDIPAGSYRVRFATGRDWDADLRAWQRPTGFDEFQEVFDFTETVEHYTTWEITLQPIVGGTAKTIEIDPATFAE